jgi:methionyl-tRNA formyltransferase
LGDPSYAPKFTPDELWINWQRPAHDIQSQVRALADVGAKTTLESKLVKVFKVRISRGKDLLPPGHYVADKESLYVGTGQDSLEILSLQLEGRKKQDAASFVNGLREKEGVFGA